MWGANAVAAVAGFTLLLGAASVTPIHNVDCHHLPATNHPKAVANSNRTPVGKVQNGVVTVRLVMRDASWYPDGPEGCALSVHAFADEGQAARIPGPLIRVRAGTAVTVRVRNALSRTVWLRGLQARDASVLDSTEIAPGDTREFQFRAGAPGAWYYWAGSANARVPESNENGQLIGALVVDSAPTTVSRVSGSGRISGDRIFVMTRWTPGGTTGNRGFQLNAINGLSWPRTERLTYTMGDSVRWLVINASDELHMMHLHGFYYNVEARGDAAHDSALARARPATVVTVATRRGEWMSMTWSPDRPGNWLFHCHIVAHMHVDQRLSRSPGSSVAAATAHSERATDGEKSNHAAESMAGLVLGVTVLPSRQRAATGNNTAARERVLHLFANTRPRMFDALPGFGFVLQQDSHAPARDSVVIPGTPLLLVKGEPVSIVVHNRLTTPIAVHWHGIELDSYADGVGGWSGMGRRIAPMIAPADSFVARFTPPRAGTFMYHVHNEHGHELASGLYAPLLVLEPGQPFDSRTEHVFVIASGGPGTTNASQEPPAFVNGTANPDTLSLVAGTKYRLRLIDISANDAHVVTLTGPAGPVSWRVTARDGRDVPARDVTVQLARETVASGVTRDFEFTPESAGNYALTVTTVIATKPLDRVTTVPIRVRAR